MRVLHWGAEEVVQHGEKKREEIIAILIGFLDAFVFLFKLIFFPSHVGKASGIG